MGSPFYKILPPSSHAGPLGLQALTHVSQHQRRKGNLYPPNQVKRLEAIQFIVINTY